MRGRGLDRPRATWVSRAGGETRQAELVGARLSPPGRRLPPALQTHTARSCAAHGAYSAGRSGRAPMGGPVPAAASLLAAQAHAGGAGSRWWPQRAWGWGRGPRTELSSERGAALCSPPPSGSRQSPQQQADTWEPFPVLFSSFQMSGSSLPSRIPPSWPLTVEQGGFSLVPTSQLERRGHLTASRGLGSPRPARGGC